LKKRIATGIVSKLMPAPIKTRHTEYSMIFSADDDASHPSEYLISTAIEAIESARKISLNDISARMRGPPYFPDIWPGEHYRLLAGFVSVLNPRVVIEIGTGSGLSALSMKKYLPQDSKMVTFDITPYKSLLDTCLRDDDFRDGRLVQYIDDLSNPSIIPKYLGLLEEANVIFVDAAKDGTMEKMLLDNFRTISFREKLVIIFDDIRVWNMLKIWRDISSPKLDLTSFGHWSGTGIVEWT